MNTIYKFALLVALGICLASASSVAAQTVAQERADALRLQLEEVKTKELDLQSRLQTLEEQLKPENIEKSLAGIGSTKPEELRETKRKQLETQKNGVQKQLALIAESRTRLEMRIGEAEAAAYHESARQQPASSGAGTPAVQPKEISPVGVRRARRVNRPRRTLGVR